MNISHCTLNSLNNIRVHVSIDANTKKKINSFNFCHTCVAKFHYRYNIITNPYQYPELK